MCLGPLALHAYMRYAFSDGGAHVCSSPGCLKLAVQHCPIPKHFLSDIPWLSQESAAN